VAPVGNEGAAAEEPLVRNISDTARWVAAYRARETERPNPLFRDPFARRLAGERGERIAQALPLRRGRDWSLAIRTYLFDAFVTEGLAQGVDLVVNLAAGLDTRPYRMDLPPSLQWVEVDLPEIFDYKEGILAGETPRCALRRVRLDLSDETSRRRLFAELGHEGKRVLVLTEGLLIYLTPEQVGGLARDLAGPASFHRWALDLSSPGLKRMIDREVGPRLAEARAPFQFAPVEGPLFFEPHGWRAVDIRSFFKWAAKKNRLPFWMRLLALLPESKGRQGNAVWAAVCLLEKT
jgi:methyltransferase (TIGR00027 family)